MKTNGKRTLFYLILPLLLMLTSMAPAYAAEKASPAYPDRPNVVWNVSSRKVVVVHVLNTTAFDMELASNEFKNLWGNDGEHPQEGPTSMNPTAFSPSGIPHKIPAKSGASFVVSWLDTAVDHGDNNNDVLPDLNMAYTMKQVKSNFPATDCPKNLTTGDITIHLNFNRIKETQKSLKSDIFKLIATGASLVLDAAEFAVDPNPIDAGYLLSATEIASTSKDIEAQGGSSDQFYFSAYVLPNSNVTNGNFPGVYGGSTNLYATSANDAAPYDGLYSQHGTTQGCPQAYIIPAIMVQREKTPDHSNLNGHLPVVFVTLADAESWETAINTQKKVSLQASSAGYKITQQMQREGKKGHVAFIKLAGTLDYNDRTLLSNAYKAIDANKPLSHEEEAFLLRFAEALEKHETSLPGSTKTNDRQSPVHKHK